MSTNHSSAWLKVRVKCRGVHLYALKEEDESMREQYSASPSVIVFCHSVKLRIVKRRSEKKRLPRRLIGAESRAERMAR